MKENAVLDKSFRLSVETTKFCVRGPVRSFRIIRDQLLRSATSAGAHVEEAQGSYSRTEFCYKMSGALKEAREALYWLRITREAELSPSRLVDPLIGLSEEVVRLLTVIVRSTRPGDNSSSA